MLLRRVGGIGSEGEIVEVSDGHARNFLIPRGLAAPATEGTERFAGRMKHVIEARRQKEDAELAALAEKLGKAECTLARKAGEDGKLFGSVTAADVAEALRAQGFEVDRKSVQLPEHIKTTGVFSVRVVTGGSHEASVRVSVVKEHGGKG